MSKKKLLIVWALLAGTANASLPEIEIQETLDWYNLKFLDIVSSSTGQNKSYYTPIATWIIWNKQRENIIYLEDIYEHKKDNEPEFIYKLNQINEDPWLNDIEYMNALALWKVDLNTWDSLGEVVNQVIWNRELWERADRIEVEDNDELEIENDRIVIKQPNKNLTHYIYVDRGEKTMAVYETPEITHLWSVIRKIVADEVLAEKYDNLSLLKGTEVVFQFLWWREFSVMLREKKWEYSWYKPQIIDFKDTHIQPWWKVIVKWTKIYLDNWRDLLDMWELKVVFDENSSKVTRYRFMSEHEIVIKKWDTIGSILESVEVESEEYSWIIWVTRENLRRQTLEIYDRLYPEKVKKLWYLNTLSWFSESEMTLWESRLPRIVDIAFENLVWCANMIRKLMWFWIDPEKASYEENSFIIKENIDAWILPDELKKIWFENSFDFRQYFDKRRTTIDSPFYEDNKSYDAYIQDIKSSYTQMMADPDKYYWSLVTMLFRYSSFKRNVREYMESWGWFHPNTHVWLILGEKSFSFKASEMKITKSRIKRWREQLYQNFFWYDPEVFLEEIRLKKLRLKREEERRDTIISLLERKASEELLKYMLENPNKTIPKNLKAPEIHFDYINYNRAILNIKTLNSIISELTKEINQLDRNKNLKISEESMDIIHFLRHFIQNRLDIDGSWDKDYYSFRNNIYSGIWKYAELIDIKINWEKIDLRKEYEKYKFIKIAEDCVKKNSWFQGNKRLINKDDFNSCIRYEIENNGMIFEIYEGQKFFITEHFKKREVKAKEFLDLLRENIESIKVFPEDEIELWWLTVIDWVHGYSNPLKEERETMRSRVRFFWEFLTSSSYYIPEIISPWEWSIFKRIEKNSLYKDTKIKTTYALRYWDSLFNTLKEVITIQEWLDITSPHYMDLVKYYYGEQIKWLQVFGYLQTEGEVNPWALVVNIPLPYFETKTIPHNRYIEKRRGEIKDKREKRAKQRDFGNIVFYPNDSVTDIFNNITNELYYHEFKHPELSYIRNLDPLQRQYFLYFVLEKKWRYLNEDNRVDFMNKRNINVNSSMSIDISDILDIIEEFKINKMERVGDDRTADEVIDLVARNENIASLLDISRFIESENGEGNFWYGIISRKNLKRVLNIYYSIFWKEYTSSLWDYQIKLKFLDPDWVLDSISFLHQREVLDFLYTNGESFRYVDEEIGKLRKVHEIIKDRKREWQKIPEKERWVFRLWEEEREILRDVIQDFSTTLWEDSTWSKSSKKNNNLVWQVMSTHIAKAKLMDISNHFSHILFNLVKENPIEIILDEQSRKSYYAMILLWMNQGENNMMFAIGENYIVRILKLINPDIDIPEKMIEKKFSKWIGGKIYWLSYITNNLDKGIWKVWYDYRVLQDYILKYQVEMMRINLSWKDKVIFKYMKDKYLTPILNQKSEKNEENINAILLLIYDMLGDTKIKDFLKDKGFDSSIPTLEEIWDNDITMFNHPWKSLEYIKDNIE